MSRRDPPPLWLLVAALFAVPAWLGGICLFNNWFSGWRELAARVRPRQTSMAMPLL